MNRKKQKEVNKEIIFFPFLICNFGENNETGKKRFDKILFGIINTIPLSKISYLSLVIFYKYNFQCFWFCYLPNFYNSFKSTTAVADIPFPLIPKPSSVVAFIEIFINSVSRSSEMFFLI